MIKVTPYISALIAAAKEKYHSEANKPERRFFCRKCGYQRIQRVAPESCANCGHKEPKK